MAETTTHIPRTEEEIVLHVVNTKNLVDAVMSGRFDLLKLMVEEHGIKPTEGRSIFAIHTAAHSGREDMAEYLIQHGASVDVLNEHKRTPLHIAADKGQANMAAFLIGKGADVNASDSFDKQPLHYAIKQGHEDIARQLIGAGAVINQGDYLGKTPLHLAAKYNRTATVALLLSKGAEKDAKSSDNMTPWDYANCAGHTLLLEELQV